VLLGPSLFGRLAPDAYHWVFGDATIQSVIFAFAWIGVILLLVVIGFETDLGIISRFRNAAGWVSAGGFIIPFAVMFGAAMVVPDTMLGENASRSVFAGFFALALSVSALPVVAKILHDLNLLRRNFGQITLAAGMVMDGVGWLILAALTGIAIDGFRLDLLGRSFGGLVIFLILAITLGRRLLDAVMRLEDFPILVEAWRTCLQDEFDLPALHRALAELESGAITWSSVRTEQPSPFARTIAWRQINQYMYMSDAPAGGGNRQSGLTYI
jgi:Kef-type K+ transport system membrane component KefB